MVVYYISIKRFCRAWNAKVKAAVLPDEMRMMTQEGGCALLTSPNMRGSGSGSGSQSQHGPSPIVRWSSTCQILTLGIISKDTDKCGEGREGKGRLIFHAFTF